MTKNLALEWLPHPWDAHLAEILPEAYPMTTSTFQSQGTTLSRMLLARGPVTRLRRDRDLLSPPSKAIWIRVVPLRWRERQNATALGGSSRRLQCSRRSRHHVA